MSRTQRVVSVWLIFHVAAIGLTAIPDSAHYQPPSATRSLGPFGTASVAPTLDVIASALVDVTDGLWRATTHIRRVTGKYVRAVGSLEEWRMFLKPATTDTYLRVTYHIRPADRSQSQPWSAIEMGFPAHPDGDVRGFGAYRTKPRDKAIDSAIDLYFRDRSIDDLRRLRSSDLPDDLVPVSRYFAREFRRQHLKTGEELARVELWFGRAPNPPLGERLESSAQAERAARLGRYYTEAVERLPETPYRAVGATETEADILWMLIYVEQL